MFQKIVKSLKPISLPEIYIKLKGLIESCDYSMADVSLLVEHDPGMAARFLQVVNSPLYRGTKKIETVRHAVSMLGIHQVHDIVLSASVTEAFEGIKHNVMNMKKFWEGSFFCALTAKKLALECAPTDSDRLVAIGLLHDFGHLGMYLAIPEEAQTALLEAKKLGRPLYQVERDLLGFDYAEIGGYMMRHWDLPKSIQITIQFHLEPGKANFCAMGTALLHLSSLLVQSSLEKGIFGEGAFAVDPSAWEITNLTEEQCLHCRQSAANEFAAVSDRLFL
ncbi:MAG: HDOD domain-containing protein [Deltaproteobacteria bacterium]|nr:HDOD domain-containing protein [Deltaproteobacteria bacterium]